MSGNSVAGLSGVQGRESGEVLRADGVPVAVRRGKAVAEADLVRTAEEVDRPREPDTGVDQCGARRRGGWVGVVDAAANERRGLGDGDVAGRTAGERGRECRLRDGEALAGDEEACYRSGEVRTVPV